MIFTRDFHLIFLIYISLFFGWINLVVCHSDIVVCVKILYLNILSDCLLNTYLCILGTKYIFHGYL